MLHDAGKILHPAELAGAGALHEHAGEQMLLQRGVDAAVARCCVSHAKWATMTCSLEELLVALADALWKGVRREALERNVFVAESFVPRSPFSPRFRRTSIRPRAS